MAFSWRELVYDNDEEVVVLHYLGELFPRPQRNIVHMHRDRGNTIVYDMLNNSNEICVNMCRMNRKTFVQLCYEMRKGDYLKDTKNVAIEEQLRFFLELCGHREGQRVVGHHMSHSTETINRHFNKVMKSLYMWSAKKIVPLLSHEHTPSYIRNKEKYYPWFMNCIGAIDGTHVVARVPPEEEQAFRGKTKKVTQNIMAVCDFSMQFTFAVAGWEGSAHDSKVFSHAINDTDSRFSHPPLGKYYLVDAGYPNMKGYLGPYKGTRYHIPEFRQRGPLGRNERYNSHHSSLRNIIERTFGVWKERWIILSDFPKYSFKKQCKIVLVTMALHNFIKEEQGAANDPDLIDALFKKWENENMVPAQEEEENIGSSIVNDDASMAIVRNGIRDAIGDYYGLPLET